MNFFRENIRYLTFQKGMTDGHGLQIVKLKKPEAEMLLLPLQHHIIMPECIVGKASLCFMIQALGLPWAVFCPRAMPSPRP